MVIRDDKRMLSTKILYTTNVKAFFLICLIYLYVVIPQRTNKMQLSNIMVRQIRLDKNYHLLPQRGKGLMLKYSWEWFLKPYVNPNDETQAAYSVGIRLRASMYKDVITNEFAGYLGEVEALILKLETKESGKIKLAEFVKEAYKALEKIVVRELGDFNLDYLPEPDFKLTARTLLNRLEGLGLYK